MKLPLHKTSCYERAIGCLVALYSCRSQTVSFVEHLPTSMRWGVKGQSPLSFSVGEYTTIIFTFSSGCPLAENHTFSLHCFKNSYWQESGFSFSFRKCRHRKFSNLTNQDYSQISYYFCSIHNFFF